MSTCNIAKVGLRWMVNGDVPPPTHRTMRDLFTSVRARCVVCAVSLASWRLFTDVRAWWVLCSVSLACWCLFTGVRTRCVVCAVSLVS